MTAIVVVAGLVGLATSAGLLAAGVASMAVRLPLAVMAAYAAFRGLVSAQAASRVGRVGGRHDIGDTMLGVDHQIVGSTDDAFTGRGGEFGGGGASGYWSTDSSVDVVESSVDTSSDSSDGSSSGSDGGSD
jgi:hypothetical protein